MKKYSRLKTLTVIILAIAALSIAACKKDKNPNPGSPVKSATPTKLGLVEIDSDVYKLLFMFVSKVGDSTINVPMIFDTGSGGLVIDAHGLVPKSMIAPNGFNFTGDSIIVSGITITNHAEVITYGADANTETRVYGNLAYAPVKIGDKYGSIQIKRVPFFLYYKGVNTNGSTAEPHSFDILGVNPIHDVVFNKEAYITSPFISYDPGPGLTRGFKMPALGTSKFSLEGTYVPGLVTVGLTQTDLSSASGFSMYLLNSQPEEG